MNGPGRSHQPDKIPNSVKEEIRLGGKGVKRKWFNTFALHDGAWGKAIASETEKTTDYDGHGGRKRWLTEAQIFDHFKDKEVAKAEIELAKKDVNTWRKHPRHPNLAKAMQYHVEIEDDSWFGQTNARENGLHFSGEVDADAVGHLTGEGSSPHQPSQRMSPQNAERASMQPAQSKGQSEGQNASGSEVGEGARKPKQKLKSVVDPELESRKKSFKEATKNEPKEKCKQWLKGVQADIMQLNAAKDSIALYSNKIGRTISDEHNEAFEVSITKLKTLRAELTEVLDGSGDCGQAMVNITKKATEDVVPRAKGKLLTWKFLVEAKRKAEATVQRKNPGQSKNAIETTDGLEVPK